MDRVTYMEAPNSDTDCIISEGEIGENQTRIPKMRMIQYLQYDEEEGMDEEMVKWAICGTIGGTQRCAIDIEEYRRRGAKYSISVDIDSVLYTSENIPGWSDIQYFPFSSMRASLQLHNHVYHALDGQRVRLSTIPNQMIGRFGEGGVYSLIEFFPRMRRKMKTGKWMSSVDHQRRKFWYNDILLDCLQRVLPRHELVHWPRSYDEARERSTVQGTFQFQWYWMKSRYMAELGRAVDRRLEMIGDEGDEYRDRFYHVYCRGIKLQSMMEGGNEMEIEELDIMRGMEGNRMEEGEESLLVDIGFECLPLHEASAEPKSMIWAKDHLEQLVRQFIPKPSRVRYDEFCVISRCAGVAAETTCGGDRGECGVVFMQAYMNSKSPLYGRLNDGGKVYFSKLMTLDRAYNGGEEYGRRMDTIRTGLKNA